MSEIVRHESAAQGAATASAAPPDVPAATFGPLRSGEGATFTALVSRAQGGDRTAFGMLVERRADGAFRTARAILGSEADAHDATQEAFLRAWRERRSLREADRFDAWFGRILVNCCREALRGRRRRGVREIAASDLADPMDVVPARGVGPDETAASLDAIERAFERLAAPERVILVLHHLERQPLAQIAATLDLPVGTVKSRLFAARQSLERALEAELR